MATRDDGPNSRVQRFSDIPRDFIHVICDVCKKHPYIESVRDMLTRETRITAFCHGAEEQIVLPERLENFGYAVIRCFRKRENGISDKTLGPSEEGN